MGGESGQNASGFSVPVVLLLTETGVAQDGASEGATPAPTTENEDDNSLGYTGTAAAFPFLMCPCIYTHTHTHTHTTPGKCQADHG